MSQDTFGMKFKDPKQATWADDKLDRKKYAIQLTQLVKRMDKPFVMTLSAPWGSGKTFFLNAWRNEIAWSGEENADKIPCVYFSAWEYDCVDDPLLAIVGKMQEELAPLLGYEVDLTEKEIAENSETQSENKGKNPFSKLTAVTKSIFTKENLCKMGWAVSGRILNKITADVFEEVIKDSVAEGILKEEDVDKLFHKTRQAVESSPKQKLEAVLEEKESFIATVKDIVAECQEKLGKKYPILIMIDELDRCRPDYVISLLERIKNLFEVDGIFFVLAIDREQLYSVVEHTFGVKKEENGRDNRAVYLQKFINMDYKLPEVNISCDLQDYFSQIFSKEIELSSKIMHGSYFVGDNRQPFIPDCYKLLSFYKVKSLRELEQKIDKLAICCKMFNLYYFEAIVVWLFILNEDNLFTIDINAFAKRLPSNLYYIIEKNIIYNVLGNLSLLTSGQQSILGTMNIENRPVQSEKEICCKIVYHFFNTTHVVSEQRDLYLSLIELLKKITGQNFFI